MGKFKDKYLRSLNDLVKEYGFKGLAGMGRRYGDIFELNEKMAHELNSLPKSGDDPKKQAAKQNVVDKYLRKARRILDMYAEVPERRFGTEMGFSKELGLMIDHILKENPRLSPKTIDRIKRIKEIGLTELGNIGSTGMKEFGSELTYAETMRAKMKDQILKESLRKAESLVRKDKEHKSMEEEDKRSYEMREAERREAEPESKPLAREKVSFMPVHIQMEQLRQERGHAAHRERAEKALEDEMGKLSFIPKPSRK
jgi:hypothetical protein